MIQTYADLYDLTIEDVLPLERMAQKSAENLSLPIRSPNTLNSSEELNFFKSLNPDIVIVVAYGQIIPKTFLHIPKKGFINIHASLLPKWRGAAPIQRAIINLDKEIGISIMKITEELDAGPVMQKIKININSLDSSLEVSKKLSKIGSEHIIQALDDIFNDKAKFVEQENIFATYAKKIKKEEGKINWEESAKNIISKINDLKQELSQCTEYKKKKIKNIRRQKN